MVMPEDRKHTRILLLIAGVLALLLAVKEAVLYLYANAHLKEILRNSPAKLFGFFLVTENDALANPNLIIFIVCVLLAAGCFWGSRKIKKSMRRRA
jgi:uncharacterized protein YpmB